MHGLEEVKSTLDLSPYPRRSRRKNALAIDLRTADWRCQLAWYKLLRFFPWYRCFATTSAVTVSAWFLVHRYPAKSANLCYSRAIFAAVPMATQIDSKMLCVYPAFRGCFTSIERALAKVNKLNIPPYLFLQLQESAKTVYPLTRWR